MHLINLHKKSGFLTENTGRLHLNFLKAIEFPSLSRNLVMLEIDDSLMVVN